jgi:hypothetical protein
MDSIHHKQPRWCPRQTQPTPSYEGLLRVLSLHSFLVACGLAVAPEFIYARCGKRSHSR